MKYIFDIPDNVDYGVLTCRTSNGYYEYNFDGEDLKQLPPAQPHWIPCSERLPENDDDVLVQMNDGSMMVDYRTASSNGWFWAELDDEPVAWMPLPEPYKVVTE